MEIFACCCVELRIVVRHRYFPRHEIDLESVCVCVCVVGAFATLGMSIPRRAV